MTQAGDLRQNCLSLVPGAPKKQGRESVLTTCLSSGTSGPNLETYSIANTAESQRLRWLTAATLREIRRLSR